MLTTSYIETTPAWQWFPANNGQFFAVTLASNAGNPVLFASDANGVNPLAGASGVAASGEANFANAGGFFYSSPAGPSGFTVVSASQKLADLLAFTSITNSTSELVTGQVSLPANLLFKGAMLRARFQATCSGVTSTPTIQAKLYLGPNGTTADTALITCATTAILANGIVTGETLLAVQAAPGAAAAILGTGTFALAGAAGQAVSNATLASTNFATNALLYLTLTLKWSAASASNIAAGTLLTVELI